MFTLIYLLKSSKEVKLFFYLIYIQSKCRPTEPWCRYCILRVAIQCFKKLDGGHFSLMFWNILGIWKILWVEFPICEEEKYFDKITLKMGWNLSTEPRYFFILYISITKCYLHQNGVKYDLINSSIKIFSATSTTTEPWFKTPCTLNLLVIYCIHLFFYCMRAWNSKCLFQASN